MTKQRIIDIAEKQMKRGGYEALNFREIAEELGVSKANIHHHFKNKITLAKEVTTYYTDLHFNFFSEQALKHNYDFVEFAREVETFFWESASEESTCSVCVCSQVIRDGDAPDELMAISRDHFDKIQSLITGIIQKSIDNGSINKNLHSQDVATQFSIMMFGVQTLAQTMPTVKEARMMLNGQIYNWAKTLKGANN